MDLSIVVEEYTTGQFALLLLTDRVRQATEYFSVLRPSNRRSTWQKVHQQYSLGIPEDGDHDLASQWLSPKFEWCWGLLILYFQAMLSSFVFGTQWWIHILLPLKSHWVCIVQSQQSL